MFTISTSAAEAATSGKCGENLTWKFDDKGTLTISGTGDMDDYDDINGKQSPWYEYKADIRQLIIGNNVTSIDYDVFYNCKSLTSITIPKNAKHISNYAFHGCFNLESIIVKKGNTVYDSRNNCNAVIETATNTLVIGCKNTVIPESVTSIGEAAFSGCKNFKSIMIPEGVASISDRAFANCISLNDVYYTGSEADRNTIGIKENNENLLSATWHYNSDGNDFCEDDFYEDDVDDYISETTFFDRFVSNIMDMFERVWSFIVGMFSFSFFK